MDHQEEGGVDGAPRPGSRPAPGTRQDRQGLEIIPVSECLERIDEAPVGRVAFPSDEGLTILPVNHVRRGLEIFFRTTVGAKLDAAVQEAEVAFEVDGFDAERRTGWSVMVRGTAAVADLEIGGVDGSLDPWADTVPRDTWIVIPIDHISGRRIAHETTAAPPLPVEHAAELVHRGDGVVLRCSCGWEGSPVTAGGQRFSAAHEEYRTHRRSAADGPGR